MKDRINKRGITTILVLTLLSVSFTNISHSQPSDNTSLKILSVDFDPIDQGKNVVHVNIRNTSSQDQPFGIHIYTRSPDYGQHGVGWGTSFSDTVRSNETKWARFAFKIQGPLTDNTWLQLKFYNADLKKNNSAKPFQETKYTSGDLKHRMEDTNELKPALKLEEEIVIQVFRQVQDYIKSKQYKEAWQLFTKDYQQAEFQGRFETFQKAMEPEKLIDSAFYWEKNSFLKLNPNSVVKKKDILNLAANCENQIWAINFAFEDNQWKIDWVANYVPRILLWQNWEQRLLPTMEKRDTEHLDIYTFKNSTAEKEIKQIAELREKGFSQICKFIGKDFSNRIRLILFEDGQTKHSETGHQGNGWAYGNTIVEVYNEKQKLDPYHEMTHILMEPLGNPPALFNEGFAVYMSETLGSKALEYLSGGQATISERTLELKGKGQWINLTDLITYNEIGSEQTQPPLAYPEAASFVKFLIEKYGKEKFLSAYKALKNSDDKTTYNQNVKTLSDIYGLSFQELEKLWLEGMKDGNVSI